MAGAATVAPFLLQPPLLLPLSASGCRSLSCWPPRRRRTNKVLHRTSITAQIDLKPPPYSLDSLEPYMSHQTLDCHWGRHHRSHVEALNRQIKGTELDEVQLEDIMLTSYNNGDPLPAFNDAAQIWNHEQFWHSMKPGGGGRPSGTLLELIERDFDSFELMVEEFKRTAASQFGSGWVWLTYKANRLNVGNAVNPHPSEKDNKIVVAKSPNAINPLVWDYSPLLVVDVWEHAYYLDYENRRVDYISTFMDKLVAWDVVSSRLDSAIARAAERAKQEESTGVEENKDDPGENEVREVYLDSENESEAE